jgi:hypothetical protein
VFGYVVAMPDLKALAATAEKGGLGEGYLMCPHRAYVTGVA